MPVKAVFYAYVFAGLCFVSLSFHATAINIVAIAVKRVTVGLDVFIFIGVLILFITKSKLWYLPTTWVTIFFMEHSYSI